MKIILIVVPLFLLSWTSIANAQNKHDRYFGDWSEGKGPIEIGRNIANHFIKSPHFNYGFPGDPIFIFYPEVCTWYGALRFANANNDKEILQKLIDRFEPFFSTEKKLIPIPDHVDNTVFGSVPLELYVQTKKQKYLELGKMIADAQWILPERHKNKSPYADYEKRGLTWQTRMWIDDMFMITAVQSQAYRATEDRKYIDRAANEMVVYLDSLQQPNGLFYHAPDVPFFWGRGDGWMAAGMSILLKELPKDNANYSKILGGYKKMMSTLLKYQDENGMWHQLIDKPDISWVETSCSGMFTFAFINGVKSGYLDEEEYGPAARKGWLGLIKYIDENADIHEVCEGTNKKNDLQYYLDRKRNIGDMHGQAPILWCAAALIN